MRPLYLPQTPRSPKPSRQSHFWGIVSLFILLFALGSTAAASPQGPHVTDPMEDKYSQDIRAEFAKCRAMLNPMSQFFCSCRVLEKQCEAPRRLEDGDWNTVEFWPSDDEAEREVQFILFLGYDILGEFAPRDTGVVLTCMRGLSDFNVFVGGDDVDPAIVPHAMIDETEFGALFAEQDGNAILEFKDTAKVFAAMQDSETLSISYSDRDAKEHTIEFDTYGFETVTKGWEKLCVSPSS